MLSVSLLPNLRELHVGGKQRSEIFTNANEVLCLFEFCSTIATIDGRSKSQWLAETTQALNTTSISNSPRHIPIPIPVPIAIFTPRFDRASRLWQNRLIEKADEERKRNEEKYLETRKADSHEMTMNLQREKSRIAGLSRGLRAISMHAVIGILNKKYRQKHEKKISGAMILNDEKAKSLELERSCLESERALDAIKRMETEQCRESERLYIKQMIEGMQAEHCSDLSKAVATAKAFYSLQVHAIKSSLGTAIEKSEVARKFIQGKYVELEVAHAEYLREAEESKIDGERERREAEEIQAALLTETTMQDTQKELILLKCRAFCYLQLHARVRKVERESNERDLKSSAALTIERRSFQDRIDLLQQDLEATRQSVKGCDLITAIAAADNAQRLNRRDEQISVLQDQLLAAKNNMQTIVERTALLRLTDERLTSEKVADSALISELRGIISGKEDAYAKREGDMLGIIEAQEQEHRQLKESHTSLRRKAERAVKRLNSVHNAFLEAVEDRDHLARMLNDFDVEKAEREATIVELGSCIRQLQTALRNLSLNLSVTQAKGQTQTPQAVKELLVQSMQGVEGGGGCIVKEEPNTDRDDDILRYCTTSSSRDGVGVCVGDEASIPEGLNESTDFLNHSSFRSAKERDGSNSDSGRSNSLELPRVECTGDGCTSDPSPCQISTPIDSAAPIYERDNSRGADIVRRRVMPRQQVMTVANGSIGTQSANTVPNTMYCCSAVNLDTLHAELDQRTLDLEDAGSRRLYLLSHFSFTCLSYCLLSLHYLQFSFFPPFLLRFLSSCLSLTPLPPSFYHIIPCFFSLLLLLLLPTSTYFLLLLLLLLLLLFLLLLLLFLLLLFLLLPFVLLLLVVLRFCPASPLHLLSLSYNLISPSYSIVYARSFSPFSLSLFLFSLPPFISFLTCSFLFIPLLLSFPHQVTNMFIYFCPSILIFRKERS